MASVNDYLKKLLYQYDCVVVPDFGAFLTHYQPASFSETSGLFLPPRKRVAFNEALRLDDGILANYIMLHEPFTREGAQRHISLFVDGLRQQVQQTGYFDIDGLGSFTRNDEGRLQFDPSLRHNFFGEAYGMNAIAARQLVSPPVEAIVRPPVTPVLESADEGTTLIPLNSSRSYWRVAAATLLIGSLGLVSYFSVLKRNQPLQSSLSPANMLPAPGTFFSSDNEKAAPAVAPKPAVVRPTATPVATTPRPTPTPAPAPVETTPETVRPATTNVVSERTAVPVSVAPAKLHFTVIAGSFSNKRNATRLRKRLKKSGYPDAFVIAPATKDQLYKVAATGSDVREEVVEKMDALKKLTGTEPWILKN